MEGLRALGDFLLCLTITAVVVIALLCIIDVIIELTEEPICEKAGYADLTRNRYGKFCVGYDENGKVFFVDIEKIQ